MAQAVKKKFPCYCGSYGNIACQYDRISVSAPSYQPGKYKLSQYLDAAKPTFAEYLALVQKIKTAAEERKTMLTEKKKIFSGMPQSIRRYLLKL